MESDQQKISWEEYLLNLSSNHSSQPTTYGGG